MPEQLGCVSGLLCCVPVVGRLVEALRYLLVLRSVMSAFKYKLYELRFALFACKSYLGARKDDKYIVKNGTIERFWRQNRSISFINCQTRALGLCLF